MLTYYDTKPNKVAYEPQPDGTANVYIRQNIESYDETRQGPGQEAAAVKKWRAEEKNFVTTATKEYVEAHADELFYSKGDTPTIEERLAAAEDTIAALMDLVASMEGGND